MPTRNMSYQFLGIDSAAAPPLTVGNSEMLSVAAASPSLANTDFLAAPQVSNDKLKFILY